MIPKFCSSTSTCGCSLPTIILRWVPRIRQALSPIPDVCNRYNRLALASKSLERYSPTILPTRVKRATLCKVSLARAGFQKFPPYLREYHRRIVGFDFSSGPSFSLLRETGTSPTVQLTTGSTLRNPTTDSSHATLYTSIHSPNHP